jgi:hypothetical protein
LTEARRTAARNRHLIERCFGLLKAMHTGVVAMGEQPGIRPLHRADRTQVLWSRRNDRNIVTLKVRPPGFDRLVRLLSIPEGSPLCN